jgi:putative ABC transport system permease protein
MSFLGFLMKNLMRRKARTLLTILGVAVAMTTIVSLRGVAQGFQRSFVENFERRGVDLVVTAAGVPDQLRSDLDQKLGDRIRKIPGVALVTEGLVELVDVQRGEGTLSVLVTGWLVDAPQLKDLRLEAGRFLQEGDDRKILLGSTLAQHLNKAIGDTVEMQGQHFTVVGIFQSFTVFENGAAVVALPELQSLMLRKDSVTGFSVVLEPTDDKEALAESVKGRIESLRDEDGKTYRISAQTTRDYVSQSMPIQIAQGMAWVTSLIALVIGAISMLNTMIMSVFERTKEIGVLRAIGWRMRRVVYMILGEAILLSLAATAVGMIAAVGVLWGLARLPQTSGFISGELAPIVLLEGLVVTILVAVIGGGYPAYRAARWLPTEALRHE